MGLSMIVLLSDFTVVLLDELSAKERVDAVRVLSARLCLLSLPDISHGWFSNTSAVDLRDGFF
jgi:hypothetical protein